MKDMFEQEWRPFGDKKIPLWVLSLTTFFGIVGVLYLSFVLWQEAADAQRNDHVKAMQLRERDVTHLNLNDSADMQTETVRWVNLFLDDIIITSNHPQELHIESAPAEKIESYVSPEDAPSRTGNKTTAGEGFTPPPTPRLRHRHHYDDDTDSTYSSRSLSFQLHGQGLRRLSLTARIPLSYHWSLEPGLSYGKMDTDGHDHVVLGLRGTAIYHLFSKKRFETYALGGAMVEKICQGDVPLQLLLRVGVGLQYRLGSKFDLFAEPSLRYHIGNDNNIPELYGNRLGLNFSLGVSYKPWR